MSLLARIRKVFLKPVKDIPIDWRVVHKSRMESVVQEIRQRNVCLGKHKESMVLITCELKDKCYQE